MAGFVPAIDVMTTAELPQFSFAPVSGPTLA